MADQVCEWAAGVWTHAKVIPARQDVGSVGSGLSDKASRTGLWL